MAKKTKKKTKKKAKKRTRTRKTANSLQRSVEKLAKRIADCESTRVGEFVITATGTHKGTYCIQCTQDKTYVAETRAEAVPLIEIMGDSTKIRAMLDGKKDARKQYLSGGFRIRGDIAYASKLGMELGIVSEPFE